MHHLPLTKSHKSRANLSDDTLSITTSSVWSGEADMTAHRATQPRSQHSLGSTRGNHTYSTSPHSPAYAAMSFAREECGE
ncbi:hypothetical protein C0Q70_17863, partial [Pomacea canaliculata]